VNDQPIFNDTSAYNYGRYLGNRSKNKPNIFWILGGDRMPDGIEHIWYNMGRVLTDGESGGYHHLAMYHPMGGTSWSKWFLNEYWYDFNAFQTWTSWNNIQGLIWSDARLVPRKPSLYLEGAYEGGNYPPYITPTSHASRVGGP
jgi:hypothetical protein